MDSRETTDPGIMNVLQPERQNDNSQMDSVLDSSNVDFLQMALVNDNKGALEDNDNVEVKFDSGLPAVTTLPQSVNMEQNVCAAQPSEHFKIEHGAVAIMNTMGVVPYGRRCSVDSALASLSPRPLPPARQFSLDLDGTASHALVNKPCAMHPQHQNLDDHTESLFVGRPNILSSPKRRYSIELGLAPEGVLPNGRRVSATFIASNYGNQDETRCESSNSMSSIYGSGFLLGVEESWGSAEFYYNSTSEEVDQEVEEKKVMEEKVGQARTCSYASPSVW